MARSVSRRRRPVSISALAEDAPVSSRRHILDCAARLFRTQGYAATSLRDIAEAAGMRAASLYHHFESRDEIVIEVLNRGVLSVFEEVRRSLTVLGDDASCEKLVTTAIAAHLRSLLELQDYTSANTRIYGQTPERVRKVTLGPRREYERLWTDLLQRCQEQGAFRDNPDLHLLRLFLFGAMNGALEWYHPSGQRSVDDIARELAGILLRGAGARTNRQP